MKNLFLDFSFARKMRERKFLVFQWKEIKKFPEDLSSEKHENAGGLYVAFWTIVLSILSFGSPFSKAFAST